MNHFIEFPKIGINASTESYQRHAVFCYFLSDDIKQDAATTTAHSKCFISLLKEKLLTSALIKIWENTHGCAHRYICASSL